MNAKRIFSILLCAALLLTPLPVAAKPAENIVKIAGVTLNDATPYYVDGSAVSKENLGNKKWSAWLEIEAGGCTLHLKDLELTGIQEEGIKTFVNRLTLDLQGENSISMSDLSESSTIDCHHLVITGSGMLSARSGKYCYGILASYIDLDHCAYLSAEGGLGALPHPHTVSFADGDFAGNYDAQTGDGPLDWDAYDEGEARDYPVLRFAYLYPVWVGGTQVTGANRFDVLKDGTVSYMPAENEAQAVLTLDGASLTEAVQRAAAYAAVLAMDEPLTLHLSGENEINATSPGYPDATSAGVYSEGALTVTADRGASLDLLFGLPSGHTSPSCRAIYAGGDLTVTGGELDCWAHNGASVGIETTGTLRVKNAKLTAECDEGNPAVLARGLALDGCEITTPKGGKYADALGGVADKAGAAASLVVIEKTVPDDDDPERYQVRFETNGGGALDPALRSDESTIDLTLPKYLPVRAGYTFAGWALDAEGKDKVTKLTVTKDVTLYACWSEGTSAPAAQKNPVTGFHLPD